MRLKAIENKVKQVLINNPLSRVNNFVLIKEVYRNEGIPVESESFSYIVNHYNLIPFESILRARRKIVNEMPGLKGIVEKRKEKEQEYFEYALEKNA